MYQDPEVGTSQMWKIETIEMWNDTESGPLTFLMTWYIKRSNHPSTLFRSLCCEQEALP